MNSDKTKTLKQRAGKAAQAFALAVATMLMAAFTVSAQDLVVMEGSVHSFSVVYHEGNSFEWTYHDEAFNPMPDGTIDYLSGQYGTEVTVQFMDVDMVSSQIVYLAVTETRNDAGCSTTRAIKILLEPNNMYLEFASAETQDCFNMGDYYAPLQVGLNFLDKSAGVPIPENRFPLQVSYEIRNITDGGSAVVGNGGAPLTLEYSAESDYSLLVTEAIGELTRTIEYELTITSVTDKFQAVINNNEGDIRLQIRIINHLPQSGGMDMALAYEITPIQYKGQL